MKRNLIFIGIAIVVCMAAGSTVLWALLTDMDNGISYDTNNNAIDDNNTTSPQLLTFDPPTLDFDYSINSVLSERFAQSGIDMPSPIEISTPNGIAKYCTFFTDKQKQKHVEYCTSTELVIEDNATSQFLGNIHMAGDSNNNPKLVIVILDLPLTDSDRVASIFDTVIDITVCDCWELVPPNEFATIHEWVKALKETHRKDTTTKSKIVSLNDLQLQIEMTATDSDASLWKLFVTK